MSKLAILLAVSVFCLSGIAATVQGTVQDPSGAVIAGAEVTVLRIGASEVKTIKTDAKGHYEIGGVSPGEYQVIVKCQGFEAVERNVTSTP